MAVVKLTSPAFYLFGNSGLDLGLVRTSPCSMNFFFISGSDYFTKVDVDNTARLYYLLHPFLVMLVVLCHAVLCSADLGLVPFTAKNSTQQSFPQQRQTQSL